ncbi:MAG TPA: AAA family ATPase [Agitococcus sp.]|nr:AAA family ATPase [Agitococcus sp.]HNC03371.1 AAA family ATPase [Agitococcus sp.]HNJ87709.1 AAA family ATPase [Agitococcus sp.]HNL80607.1 AAA family ATPase [Agitococcus sp.]
MILLVGGEKGGSGKSCLAQNIAVYLQHRQKDVLLLDADPQGTTTDWAKEREENDGLTNLPCVQASGNIRQILKDLAKRYQVIVVDAGGQDSEALRSAMTVATHLLLPFRPKRRDLKTLVHVSQLVKLAKAVNPDMLVRGVITQCPTLPSQTQRILDAKEACQSFGIEPLQSITCNRNVYDDADENGSSVLEVETDLKAKEEVESLVAEFLEV